MTRSPVLDDITSVALHSALSHLAVRQRATADNVANLQTPGFLANRVSFESALADAVASGDKTAVASSRTSTARSLEPTRQDGNNVNLDRETLIDTETNLRFALVTRAANDQVKILKASIGGAA